MERDSVIRVILFFRLLLIKSNGWMTYSFLQDFNHTENISNHVFSPDAEPEIVDRDLAVEMEQNLPLPKPYRLI